MVSAPAGGRRREFRIVVPGILGLVTQRPRAWAEEELARMLAPLCHEAFYVTGSLGFPDLGLYLAWVGRQDSLLATMPLRAEDGSVLITSGTLPEMISGSSKASSWNAFGEPASISQQEGMFQGVTVNSAGTVAVLFNDRYGMHRWYQSTSPDAYYFAPEAKAILAVRPEARQFRLDSLAEFLKLGCVLENKTLFPGVELLPAGSRLTISAGRVTSQERYFDSRSWESLPPLGAGEFLDTVASAFERSMSALLHAGSEPMSVAITGGLDTRAIMAWSGFPAGSLPCFTYGSNYRDSRDVQIGRRVAAACRQPHQVLTIDREFLSRFSYYAERCTYLSEGTVTVANAPDLYLSELARRVAPAKVVGTWGSEILRRAVLFKPRPVESDLYAPELGAHCQMAEASYGRLRALHPVTFAAFPQNQWFQFGIEALEQTQLTIHAPFLSHDIVRAAYQSPAGDESDIRLDLIRRGNGALARIPSDRSASPDASPLTTWIWKALHEFTFKAEYALDMGMPKWLAPLHRAVGPWTLDPLFVGRHKFLRFRHWYQTDLASTLREVLLDRTVLNWPYWSPAKVERMIREHESGIENHTTTLHTLLTLSFLRRGLRLS